MSVYATCRPGWARRTVAQFRGWEPITALQLEYSLLERTAEGELLPMAEAMGIGVLPWSPLRGGLLSGKYSHGAHAPADSRRASHMGGPSERDWPVIDAVARIATEAGAGAAQVALAWVRSRAGVASTLVGARTAGQLRANLASLDTDLSAEQLAALDEASAPSLNFPAAINAEYGPMLGFGGASVDGVELPTWPMLLASPARY
jgi:aryl-alcohol dehydrogenase-like predicted oxidoreductase